VDPVAFRPIGIIRTPFPSPDGMPIQAVAARGVAGTIEIDDALVDGLADLDGFSHLILVYHLHLMTGARLTVTPFLDETPRGVFATRSPARPNPIGISTVRLVRVRGATLDIEDVDMVDGTPLLDLKPYVPPFDDREDVRIGWFAGRLERLSEVRADDRFNPRR
jgi:tRNA-Thr(GGU) m(6)t(6)A37 methyltransferase TsaA